MRGNLSVSDPSKTDGRVPRQQGAPQYNPQLDLYTVNSQQTSREPGPRAKWAGGGGRKKMGVAQGGGGGGERFLKNNISSTYSTNQIPSDTLNCIFPGGTCLRGKYCFFHSSQPAKFCLKNGYFKEQIHWVPLYLLCLFPVFSHSGHLTSSAFLDVQLLYSLCYYMTNFCSLIGLEQWYFSLI